MSIAPAVAIRPSPEMIVVPVPTTTSTSSIMSGLPARPTRQMRPSRMPIDDLADAERVASITTTLEITTSHVSRTAAAFSSRPSRRSWRTRQGTRCLVAARRTRSRYQAGVAEAHAVADRGAVDRRVVVGQDLVGMQVVVRHVAAVVAWSNSPCECWSVRRRSQLRGSPARRLGRVLPPSHRARRGVRRRARRSRWRPEHRRSAPAGRRSARSAWKRSADPAGIASRIP